MSTKPGLLDRKFHASLVRIFGPGPAGAEFDVVAKAINEVIIEFGKRHAKRHAAYQRSNGPQTRDGDVYEEAASQSPLDALEFVTKLGRVSGYLKPLDALADPTCPPLTNPETAETDAALALAHLAGWKPDGEGAEESTFECARVMLARARLHDIDLQQIDSLKKDMEAVLKSRFGASWIDQKRIRQFFLPRPTDSVRAWFFASFKHTRRDLLCKNEPQHVPISEVAEPESNQTATVEVCEAEHARLQEGIRARTALLPPRERFVLDVTFGNLPNCWRTTASVLPHRLRHDVTRRAKSLPSLVRKWEGVMSEKELRRRILGSLLDRSTRQIRRYEKSGLERLRAGLRTAELLRI